MSAPAAIRLLPTDIVNRIAAGEVIERPAAVVKELTENALDAGATRIAALISGGGIERIEISDDGCGMAAADLALAVRAAGDAVYPGFGAALLLASLLGLVTVTSLNFYGGSLTLLSMEDSFVRLRGGARGRLVTLALVFLAATSIALLASDDFVARFSDFLAVMLYLFTPWTAINLVDFYIVRHGHYSVREIFNPNGIYGRWDWRGLSAYFGGFIAMIPFFSTGLYTGPIATRLGGADIAMVIGLPVAAGIYLLACRSLDVGADRRSAAAADAGLESES